MRAQANLTTLFISVHPGGGRGPERRQGIVHAPQEKALGLVEARLGFYLYQSNAD